MEKFWNMWSKPFLLLLNTTVFLVETAQIIAVLFVNYKGRPMGVENHALIISIFLCVMGVGIVALDFSLMRTRCCTLNRFQTTSTDLRSWAWC